MIMLKYIRNWKNFEQSISAYGGNDGTHLMSQNYERAHWQTFNQYKKQ